MARVTLTPVVLQADGGVPAAAGTAATTFVQVTAGAGNGVVFPNVPGQTLLMVAGTSAGTATVVVGSTVLGQTITSFTVPVNSLTPFAPLATIGPFHSVLDPPGTPNLVVQIDFAFNVLPYVAAFQVPNVY